MSRGLLVSFEGLDGCGKSTQIDKLSVDLKNLGLRVTVVREPGGTSLGSQIREILKNSKEPICPLAELLLFNAARAQVLQEVIRPALQRGDVVIADRYTHSTFAYQSSGRGIEPKVVWQACDVATGGLAPELTVYLKVPLSVAFQRVKARGGTDRFESLGEKFFRDVERYYNTVAEIPTFRIRTIDADQEIDRVYRDVLVAVTESLVANRMYGRTE
jgi:dTMP kinase